MKINIFTKSPFLSQFSTLPQNLRLTGPKTRGCVNLESILTTLKSMALGYLLCPKGATTEM